MSDELTLINEAKAGSVSAFTELVRTYREGLLRFLLTRCASYADAEDALQDTFINAYRYLYSYDSRWRFSTWLYRIAVNTAKNYLESQARRPPSTDINMEAVEMLEGAENLRDMATPEHNLLTDEIAHTVHRSISALPVDLRTAITLRDIDGLSYEDIAQVMECPIGTVRSRIFRAREAIDKELKPLLQK